MKKLFSTYSKSALIIPWEEERNIQVLEFGHVISVYYDYDGNNIPRPDFAVRKNEESCDYENDQTDDPTQYGPLYNGFYSYTTHEVVESIDDTFGLFGLKDKHGKVVVEEKYWDIGLFSCGLCPVRKVNGNWGCINEKGELVIPHIYWDEPVFNKNGVAYGNNSLIDDKGNEIEDTKYDSYEPVDEGDRYYKLVVFSEKQEKQIAECGVADDVTENIFDTKLREYAARDVPELRIDYSHFNGEPCVIRAAIELLDEYEEIVVKGKGIIVGRTGKSSTIYDYYGTHDGSR